MYLEGSGTKENLAAGIGWLRKAARKGDAKAQYNLGMAYRDGTGVAENVRLAQSWLSKAAKQDHKKASAALRSLRSSECPQLTA